MCGICGIIGFDDAPLLRRMCEVISHRGPDDKGIYTDDKVGLGNRRLSIIDIRGGRQPLHNEDETVWTTYNGEMYNFKGLREDLESRGHQFSTSTDTEVVVHAYEEFGDSCVHKFRGMFAFAVWDSVKERLLLARDRLGVKPLYYTSLDKGLLFGSEIKALLQYEEFERKVDYRALYNFLIFRFVPAPNTMFRGIKKLPPGSILTIENGEMKVQKYWSPKAMHSATKSEAYYIERLRELLQESIKIRLMSDVPLGAYLSGGVDSSSIVGIMSSIMDEPVKTFSVGFNEDGYANELDYAGRVAEYFETDHHELLVDESSLKFLPQVVWHFDEPLADPAAVPTYLISELAKKDVTVVLTGEGADEIFAGYVQYKVLVGGERYLKMMPSYFRGIVSGFVRIVPSQVLDMFFPYSSSLGEKATDRFSIFVSSIEDRGECYLSVVSIFHRDELEDLCTPRLLQEGRDPEIDETINYHLESADSKSLLDQLQLMEIETELPDDLLMKVDKMTQAKSVEARVPYLDHRLVEFSSSIPEDLKLRGLTDKYVLRKAMSKFLPRGIGGRKKHRFFVPIDSWIENNREMVSQILSEESIRKRGYFKSKYIRQMMRQFQRSKLYFSRQLWSLLTLELWHQIFLDSDDLYNPSLPQLL